MIVMSRLAPYIESVRQNKRGNFVSVTVQGQQEKRTILICAYQMVPGGNSSGEATVWRQQRNQLILEQEEVEDLENPQQVCLTKLKNDIKAQREQGAILLVLDANDIRHGKSDGYQDFIEKLDLIPVIDLETAVPSRFEGKRVIDHMESYGISEQHIAKKGQLPQGIGFQLDHQAMYMDIQLEGFLGLIPEKPKDRTPRHLKSGTNEPQKNT